MMWSGTKERDLNTYQSWSWRGLLCGLIRRLKKRDKNITMRFVHIYIHENIKTENITHLTYILTWLRSGLWRRLKTGWR